MSQRKSNMELLRIFSMYLIVVFHCAYHSGFPTPPPSTDLTYNLLMVKIFWFFGELGVNLFALTTGYFQSKAHFKWGKLILPIAQIEIYSISTHFVAVLTGLLSVTDMKT